jgi:hypothetical protein
MDVAHGQRDLPRPRQPTAEGHPTVIVSAEGIFHILVQAAVVGEVRHKEVPKMMIKQQEEEEPRCVL